MSDICLMVDIRGRVQGVSFRYYTRLKAQELGVRGWVKNLPDGSVQSCICGDAMQVKHMRAWLNEGPSGARVKSVTFSEAVLAEVQQGFRVL